MLPNPYKSLRCVLGNLLHPSFFWVQTSWVFLYQSNFFTNVFDPVFATLKKYVTLSCLHIWLINWSCVWTTAYFRDHFHTTVITDDSIHVCRTLSCPVRIAFQTIPTGNKSCVSTICTPRTWVHHACLWMQTSEMSISGYYLSDALYLLLIIWFSLCRDPTRFHLTRIWLSKIRWCCCVQHVTISSPQVFWGPHAWPKSVHMVTCIFLKCRRWWWKVKSQTYDNSDLCWAWSCVHAVSTVKYIHAYHAKYESPLWCNMSILKIEAIFLILLHSVRSNQKGYKCQDSVQCVAKVHMLMNFDAHLTNTVQCSRAELSFKHCSTVNTVRQFYQWYATAVCSTWIKNAWLHVWE